MTRLICGSLTTAGLIGLACIPSGAAAQDVDADLARLFEGTEQDAADDVTAVQEIEAMMALCRTGEFNEGMRGRLRRYQARLSQSAERNGDLARALPMDSELFQRFYERSERYRAIVDASREACPEGFQWGDPGDLTVPAGVTGLSLSLAGEYGTFDRPPTGIGFQRDGALGTAPDLYALEAGDRVDYWGLRFEASADNIELSLFYREGESEDSISIPNTFDNGVVYGSLFNGSSGIGANADLDAFMETQVTNWGAKLQFVLSLEAPPPGSTGAHASVAPFIGFERNEVDTFGFVDGTVVTPGFTFEFDQTRDQRLTEDRYQLGLRAEAGVEFVQGFDITLGGQLSADLFDHRLESGERNTNNFTGAPQSDFRIEIDDDDSGVGVSWGIDLTLILAPTENVELFIGGAVEGQTSAAQVLNPNSGDQVFFEGQQTRLELSEREAFYGFAGARVRF